MQYSSSKMSYLHHMNRKCGVVEEESYLFPISYGSNKIK